MPSTVRPHLLPIAIAAASSFGAPPSLADQFDDAWLTLEPSDSIAGISTDELSGPETEVDFATGDLDGDGWTDVVAARKQPFTTAGRRANVLLWNDRGTLTDRTAELATASDVAGDAGFLTPTNDRDVAIVDLDGDGWPEVVTATTISQGLPKAIGHPRVYRNLAGPPGAWGGLRYEEARVPQLLTPLGQLPQNPEFCAVAPGDVDADGAIDLYFVDYTLGGSVDMDDRLLVNDGQGYFLDESQSRMTPQMLATSFGTSAVIGDVNLDGAPDVVRATALSIQYVSVAYNDPTNPGHFLHLHDFQKQNPYHVNLADLNNDGRLDVLVSDDNADRYRYNTGVDALGRVVWGPAETYEFLAGADDGEAGNVYGVDLDGDGWTDVLACDMDVDFPGCSRRAHLYHNPGASLGETPRLREERQGSSDAGWVGAVGLGVEDLRGTYDAAILDLDADGDLDLVLGRCSGTACWENRTIPPTTCQPDLGFGGPGAARLELCGAPLDGSGTADLRLTQAPAFAPVLLVVGFLDVPTDVLGGTLVPVDLALTLPFLADEHGGVHLAELSGGVAQSVNVYFQVAVVDAEAPFGIGFSNAVCAELLP